MKVTKFILLLSCVGMQVYGMSHEKTDKSKKFVSFGSDVQYEPISQSAVFDERNLDESIQPVMNSSNLSNESLVDSNDLDSDEALNNETLVNTAKNTIVSSRTIDISDDIKRKKQRKKDDLTAGRPVLGELLMNNLQKTIENRNLENARKAKASAVKDAEMQDVNK